MTMKTIDLKSRSTLEVSAVLLTGALHLVFEEVLHQKTAFIVLALVGWSTYLGLSIRKDRGILDVWGMRLKGFGRAMVAPALVLLAGAVVLAGVGLLRNTLTLNLHMVPLLVLYPVWGIAQQFMVQAMVSRNLHQRIASPWAVTAIAALLFGAVHWPDPFLMPATFTLALVFTPIYLKQKHILPLGLCHGWLGVLAYYWLLGKDPWLDLF